MHELQGTGALIREGHPGLCLLGDNWGAPILRDQLTLVAASSAT
jgi:hypothetical protein